jgi:2-keto-4-pentenoate hydratase/2-oxohepta-3-ene-1,7-dioic acid hydratase in catechol pathway
MRLASIRVDGGEIAAVVEPGRGVARVPDLLPGFDGDIRAVLAEERVAELAKAVESAPDGLFVPEASVTFGAPYRHPRLIWGIGLNYVDHAADLSEQGPRSLRRSSRATTR